MGYVPKNVGDLVDRFAVMATKAPKYVQMYNPGGDPAGEFDLTYRGLDNLKEKIGLVFWKYLNKRVEENWERLQTGSPENIKLMKLSFGEMAYILQSGAYKSGIVSKDLSIYTDLS